MSISQNIHINNFDSIKLEVKQFETFTCIEMCFDGNVISFFAHDKDDSKDKLLQFFNNFSYRKIDNEE